MNRRRLLLDLERIGTTTEEHQARIDKLATLLEEWIAQYSATIEQVRQVHFYLDTLPFLTMLPHRATQQETSQPLASYSATLRSLPYLLSPPPHPRISKTCRRCLIELELCCSTLSLPPCVCCRSTQH